MIFAWVHGVQMNDVQTHFVYIVCVKVINKFKMLKNMISGSTYYNISPRK